MREQIAVIITDKATGKVLTRTYPDDADPFELARMAARKFGAVWPEHDPDLEAILFGRRVSAAQPPKKKSRSKNIEPVYQGVPSVRMESQDAYDKLKSTGKLSKQQQIVVDYLARAGAPATRTEVHRGTGLTINAVCGRVKELIDMVPPRVREAPKRACHVTGENVNTLELVP